MPDEPDRLPIVPERPPRRGGRSLLRWVLPIAAIALLGLAAGFVHFVDQIADQDTEFGAKADGVIALTGGADRIAAALSIMDEGRAKRLLITGVHPQTSEFDLIRQMGHRALFACCIDIDKRALNTVGNAREVSRWAQSQDFSSLLVVTSGYHMPRAMLELSRFAPKVTLIPHPVFSETARPDDWIRNLAVARLLLAEYVKFVGASLRGLVAPRPLE